jgi:hypothetical protein
MAMNTHCHVASICRAGIRVQCVVRDAERRRSGGRAAEQGQLVCSRRRKGRLVNHVERHPGVWRGRLHVYGSMLPTCYGNACCATWLHNGARRRCWSGPELWYLRRFNKIELGEERLGVNCAIVDIFDASGLSHGCGGVCVSRCPTSNGWLVRYLRRILKTSFQHCSFLPLAPLRLFNRRSLRLSASPSRHGALVGYVLPSASLRRHCWGET